MEIKQLQLFVAVAEDLHFGRAAERMFIAQPALSQHVRRLERELGVELFDRRGRNIKLTAPGRAFLGEARRVVRQSERAAGVARRAGEGSEGVLSIGYYPGIAAHAVPQIVQPFLDQAEGMSIHLVADGRQALDDALLRGDMDLAVTSGPVLRSGMVSLTLRQSHLVVVMPTDHPLSCQDEVDFASLEDVPLVMNSRMSDPQLFDSVVSACHNAGFNARTAHVVKSPELVLPAVVCGLGLGIVPSTVMQSWGNASVVSRPIANGPSTDIVLVRRVDRSESAVLDFWSFVEEELLKQEMLAADETESNVVDLTVPVASPIAVEANAAPAVA